MKGNQINNQAHQDLKKLQSPYIMRKIGDPQGEIGFNWNLSHFEAGASNFQTAAAFPDSQFCFLKQTVQRFFLFSNVGKNSLILD